jgi:non-heme chloroperoxidase
MSEEMASACGKRVKNGQLKIYPGAPHGMTTTHKDQINADLLNFIKA